MSEQHLRLMIAGSRAQTTLAAALRKVPLIFVRETRLAGTQRVETIALAPIAAKATIAAWMAEASVGHPPVPGEVLCYATLDGPWAVAEEAEPVAQVVEPVEAALASLATAEPPRPPHPATKAVAMIRRKRGGQLGIRHRAGYRQRRA